MKGILVGSLLFCILSNVERGNSECRETSYIENYRWRRDNVQKCFLQVLPKDYDFPQYVRQRVYEVDIKLTSDKDVNITSLDLGEFHQLKRLDLSKNHIINLTDLCFLNFSNLEVLHISKNKLTVLPGNIFLPNYQLKEVDISYNGLTQLPNFNSLKKLEMLDLRENQLLSASSVVWPNSLKNLYLGGNNLSEIPDFCKSDLSNLIYLDISKNNLKQFKHGVFDCMINLQTLNASLNAIQDIPVYVYSNLRSLTKFYIDNNQISNLDMNSLCQMTAIQHITFHAKNSHVLLDVHQDVYQVDAKPISYDIYHNSLIRGRLDLSKNHILNLTDLSFFHFSNFEVLNINENKLTVLPRNIFLPSPQLREVNISYNRLTQLPDFASLEKLEILDLRENQLLSASYVVWPNSLKDIYLGGNNLSEIPDFCKSNLSNLMYLDISKNNLKEFKHGVLDCMINLQTLNVSFNAFKDIPVYVYHQLRSLRKFYVHNNQVSNLDINFLLKMTPVQEITFHNNKIWHCDQLSHMFQVLKQRDIYVPYQGFKNETNIHGILCSKEETPQPQTNISDQDFRNRSFSKDFQKSNSFGYLESFRNAKQPEEQDVDVDKKFKDSATFRYINDDFQKSNLFKYLESLKKLQVIIQRISDNGSDS